MALVQRFVNTGSTAGGDGTTNNLAGATRAYASMREWESNEQTNLVSATDQHQVDCAGTTSDEGTGSASSGNAVTITGWTTDNTYFVTIRGNPSDPAGRHEGVWSTSFYRLEVYETGVTSCLSNEETGTKIMGIQVSPHGNGNYANGGIDTTSDLNSGDNFYVQECVIKANFDITKTSGNPTGIDLSTNTGVLLKIGNNIIQGFERNNGSGEGINATYGTLYLYCNTIVDCATGINAAQSNRVRAKDNIVQGAVNGYNGTFHGDSDYNISNIAADAPGATVKNSATVSFIGGGDYHLDNADTVAKGWGLNLFSDSGFPITIDIDEDARLNTGQFDSGADTIIAGGGGGGDNNLLNYIHRRKGKTSMIHHRSH